MVTQLKCDDCQDVLIEFALGELSPAESEVVAAHLESGCEPCLRQWNELSETIEVMTEPLPLQTPSNDTWSRISAAIDAQASDAPAAELTAASWTHPAAPRDRWGSWIAPLLAVACGFALTAVVHRWFAKDRLPRVVVVEPIGTSTPFPAELGSAALPDRAPQPASTLVSMHSPSRPEIVAGRMMIDGPAGQVHVHVQLDDQLSTAGVEGPPPGNSHVKFWFVTDEDQWIFGGTLNPLTATHYGNVIDIPSTRSRIVHTAISVGDFDPSSSPRTDVSLVSDSLDADSWLGKDPRS